MNNVFAPGCGLYLYKPQLAEKKLKLLQTSFPGLLEHSICCHYEPNLPDETRLINICAGCDKRYLVDLLFGEATEPGECEPDLWHAQLDEFIAAH